MSSYKRLEKSLLTGRAGYVRGLRVLVNGSLDNRKCLPSHVAEHAAEKVDDYVEKLETIIADLLRLQRCVEVEH